METETLVLRPISRNSGWLPALFMGLALAYVAIMFRQRFFPSVTGDFFSSTDYCLLFLSALVAFLLGSLESSVAIELSEPPVLVAKSLWLWTFASVKRTPLSNCVWARVVWDGDGSLLVQVGTYGQRPTNVMCMGYSEKNIPVAETQCAKVASALLLENKGYRGYF
jgi:hypothetical protein